MVYVCRCISFAVVEEVGHIKKDQKKKKKTSSHKNKYIEKDQFELL